MSTTMKRALYEYSPIAPDEIRLLQLCGAQQATDPLHCSIRYWISESPYRDYDALSYTWGEPVFDRSLIIDFDERDPSVAQSQNGVEIAITANLDAALRRIRKDIPNKHLWIDAVCINQLDISERTDQVQIMGKIYSEAKYVIVWTGLDCVDRRGARALEILASLIEMEVDTDDTFLYLDKSSSEFPEQLSSESTLEELKTETKENAKDGRDTSDQADKWVDDITSEQPDYRFTRPQYQNAEIYTSGIDNTTGQQRIIRSDCSDDDYSLLGSFFQRPYFSRRWIIQEICLARDIVIYCGATALSVGATLAILTTSKLPNQDWPGRERVVAFADMLLFRMRVGVEMKSPVSFLSAFSQSQCRDDRDHVFAMVGVLGAITEEKQFAPGHVLRTVTYSSSVADVYTAMARYLLPFGEATATLSLAGAMRLDAISRLEEGPRLPSWVPDWRNGRRSELIDDLKKRSTTNMGWTSKKRTHDAADIEDAIYRAQTPRDSTSSLPLPWKELVMPSCFVHPSALRVYGLPIDTIEDTICLDLFKHEHRLAVKTWLAKGHFTHFYRGLWGSLVEAASDAIVGLCYDGPRFINITSWVQDNRRKLLEIFEKPHADQIPEFRHFCKILHEVMRGQLFVRTRSGYLGIGSKHSRRGDRVVLLVRQPITFFLRELASSAVPLGTSTSPAEMTMSKHVLFGPYELIGRIYIHGIDLKSYDAFSPKPLLIY